MVKDHTAIAGDTGDSGLMAESRSWKRKWQPTPVFLPGKTYGQEEPGGLLSIGSQKSQTQLND